MIVRSAVAAAVALSFRSAKLLHAAGADANTVDADGGSRVDSATNWASAEFYQWLVSIGCRRVDEKKSVP